MPQDGAAGVEGCELRQRDKGHARCTTYELARQRGSACHPAGLPLGVHTSWSEWAASCPRSHASAHACMHACVCNCHGLRPPHNRCSPSHSAHYDACHLLRYASHAPHKASGTAPPRPHTCMRAHPRQQLTRNWLLVSENTLNCSPEDEIRGSLAVNPQALLVEVQVPVARQSTTAGGGGGDSGGGLGGGGLGGGGLGGGGLGLVALNLHVRARGRLPRANPVRKAHPHMQQREQHEVKHHRAGMSRGPTRTHTPGGRPQSHKQRRVTACKHTGSQYSSGARRGVKGYHQPWSRVGAVLVHEGVASAMWHDAASCNNQCWLLNVATTL